MDKLVYLHEFDSVRKAEDEIDHARAILYEEIVSNGNTVVISFNQLADSIAFLGLVTESSEMLDVIKGLMLSGAIKISRFSDKRTASQYLQDNLQPRPSGSHGKFLLSGWDILDGLTIVEQESIRDCIYRALRNSDTDYLEIKRRDVSDDISGLCEPGSAISVDRYNKMLDKLQRLVDLMLAISNSPLSYVDANEASFPTFESFLDKALEPNSSFVSPKARSMLDQVKEQLTVGERQSRSSYYRELAGMVERDEGILDIAQEAVRVLDLCYNLTTEASVRGISSHYDPKIQDSVESEFVSRLESYRRDYASFGHVYPWNHTSLQDELESNLPIARWKHALRIREAQKQNEVLPSCGFPQENTNTHPSPLYEADIDAERVIWHSRVKRSLVRNILVMVLYAVVLSFVEVIISLIQDMMVSWMKLGNDAISDMVSDQGSVVSIVVFLVGIFIFSRASKDTDNRQRARRVLIGFLGILFVVVLPLFSCIDLGFAEDSFALQVNLAALPSMVIMGIPSFVASFIGVALFAYIGWLVENRLNMPGIIDSAVSALSSMRDLVAFSKNKPRTNIGFVNERTLGIEKEAGTTIPGNAYSGAALKFVSQSQRSKSDWEKYIDATMEDGAEADKAPLKVIKDRAQVLQFERSAKGRPIGIAYSSPYSQMIVDLVEDQNGERYAYERVLPAQKGAVVVIPIFEGKYVLLRQFRHALRDFQLAFPRGYGEENLTPEENAKKELFEELGVEPIEGLKAIGKVVADSGISGNKVSVFVCDVPRPVLMRGYEGIADYELLSSADLNVSIRKGEITDGFTLSAITLLRCLD